MTNKMRCVFTILALFFSSHAAMARPIAESSVPQSLKEWIPWVLHDVNTKDCPFFYQNFSQVYCAWPGELNLTLTDNGGTFEQTWVVYRDSVIVLPGYRTLWPQDVEDMGKSTVVQEVEGLPAIQLNKGKHKIRGSFSWAALPESIQLPENTGLVKMSVGGKKLIFPQIDKSSKLWLNNDATKKSISTVRNTLGLEVFRQILDDIPLRVITRLQLDISGDPREIELGPVLAQYYIPLNLTSDLPVRLTPNGKIQLQARPGSWFVEIDARAPGQVDEIKLPESNLSNSEIWVFNSRPDFRIAEITGVPSIDPGQTRLPVEWKALPAYQINQNDVLTINTKQRGNPSPEPNKLQLTRSLWLDFDGQGYTFQDSISGEMNTGWRLSMAPEFSLGSVTVNGMDQMVTRTGNGEGKDQGVEIREKMVTVVADGRYDKNRRVIPAAGWQHDFIKVDTSLHLPPGWRLVSVNGVDTVRGNSWIESWTLLDIFLVLIVTLAVRKLWGTVWSVVVFICLGLIWHEAGAPQYVWLNLIAVVALLRVAPPGRLHKFLNIYRYLSLVVLVVVGLPYIVNSVRVAIYPQLERPVGIVSPTLSVYQEADNLRQNLDESLSRKKIESRIFSKAAEPRRQSEYLESNKLQDTLARVDPDSKVQTGPGLPIWTWTRVDVGIGGPVSRDQTIRFVVLSPFFTSLFHILSATLILLLGWRFAEFSGKEDLGRLKTTFSLITLTLLLGLIPSSDVFADTPSQSLLKQLKERLTAAPDCLPLCAQISRMSLQGDQDQLIIKLEVHSSSDVAIPIPASVNQWMPQQVYIGDKPVPVLKNKEGLFSVLVSKGTQQVILRGALPVVERLQIPLPLKPHYVEAKITGWELKGVHEDGQVEGQLQFHRYMSENVNKTKGLKATILPPFVIVDRIFHFGLDWKISTTIRRISPIGNAISMEYPLLKGESVLTDGVRINNRQVAVHMAADQMEFKWLSSLEFVDKFSLEASNNTEWIERWRLDVSPIWRVETSGLVEVNQQSSATTWQPEWRPWPGEQLQVYIQRPVGIKGATRTLNSARITVRPGQNITESELRFVMRSSQSDKYLLTLPKGIKLQSVTINGENHPIRLENDSLRIPLTPGRQEVSIIWQYSEGMATFFQSQPIQLGMRSVNATTEIYMPANRWAVFVSGPRLGPAVLFWGTVAIIVVLSFGLARVKLVPVKSYQWILLGLGLTQASIFVILIVVAWFFALAFREQFTMNLKEREFNTVQVGFALLTVMAGISLLSAIGFGLLGYPDLQIVGNGSNSHYLVWFTDRVEDMLPTAWTLSFPLWVYRLFMLLWSLWLAFAMLDWASWGWQCYTKNGLWRHVTFIRATESSEKTNKQNTKRLLNNDKSE